MSDFDLQRADRDADLYRFDGRFYDLSEAEGVLTLEMRRSVRVDRSIMSGIITAGWIGLYLLLTWLTWNDPNFKGTVGLTISLGVTLPLQMGWGYVVLMRRGVFWKFDKSTAQVFYGAAKIADFSKIKSMRAWRRGRKFHLMLQLRFGQTVKIGRLGFSCSETAWRQDAAQIAAFLGVPLEIPPL